MILHQADKSWIYTPFNPVHMSKAFLPMFVTLFGMVTFVKLEKP